MEGLAVLGVVLDNACAIRGDPWVIPSESAPAPRAGSPRNGAGHFAAGRSPGLPGTTATSSSSRAPGSDDGMVSTSTGFLRKKERRMLRTAQWACLTKGDYLTLPVQGAPVDLLDRDLPGWHCSVVGSFQRPLEATRSA